MLFRLFAILSLGLTAACASTTPSPLPTRGAPTPEATALAQQVCPAATFITVDPNHAPDTWYKC